MPASRSIRTLVERTIKGSLRRAGLGVYRLPKVGRMGAIPDASFYRPLFSPWLGYGEFERYYALAAPYTLVSRDRCYQLYVLLRHALAVPGDVWECGVYRGGTAAMLAAILAEHDRSGARRLHLFDTFAGMPETDEVRDLHEAGDFATTSLDAVRRVVGRDDIVKFHPGYIPHTFAGLEDARLAFVHIDVDIYRSVLDSCAFTYPRLSSGGVIVFDDYGFPSCPGARQAVDEFATEAGVVPIVLPTGQAVIIKH
jgi:O-methyltransferase